MANNPIFIFPNGARINLKRVIGIGAIEKNAALEIVIPLFCDGSAKSIPIIVGYSVGSSSPEQKEKISKIYQDLIEAWTTYVLETA